LNPLLQVGLLAGLGVVAGILSGRLPMSGKLALAFCGLPLLGLYLTQKYC
jgi:hypothetical protein